jgi:hypothetical protein
VGSQSLKFGADIREYRMSNYSPGNSIGRYTFGTNWNHGAVQQFGGCSAGAGTGGLSAWPSGQRKLISQLPVSQFQVRGGLTFAGPNNPYIYWTPSYDFSPRFGFAWTPGALGGKTVLRAASARSSFHSE